MTTSRISAFDSHCLNWVFANPSGRGLGPNLVPDRDQVGTKLGPGRHQVQIPGKCREELALTDLMPITGRTDRIKFRKQVLDPLIEQGWLEMTIPEKPRSSKQQYRTTLAGERLLKREGDR